MTVHVTRAEWGARPPEAVSHNIRPTSTTAHWEGVGKSSAAVDHAECAALVRGIQAFHMDTRGWSDVAYSGLACWHDHFFEGRGPGVRTAANGTTAGNNGSYAVCAMIVVGDVPNDQLKAAMTYGAAWLGPPLSKVHGDWKATACPGPELTAWVKGGVTPPAPQPTPPTPPSTVPPFPFPATHWMGVKSSNPKNHSGYISSDRPGIQKYQSRMLARGWSSLGTADGIFGSRTRDVTIKFQKQVGLSQDGLAGQATWTAAWTAPIT